MKKFVIVVLIILCILSSLPVSAANELDFNKLFDEAEDAAEWFSCEAEYYPDYGEPVPEGVETHITYNGTDYLIVGRGYNTEEKMKGYLGTLFSDKVVSQIYDEDQKNEHPYFISHNGYLYQLGGGVGGIRLAGTRSFEKILDTETKKIYRMSYIANITDGQYYGDTTEPCCVQTFDYIVEWNGERWVFSTYILPTDLWHTPDRCPNNPQTGDGSMTVLIALCALSAAVTVFYKRKHA